MALKQVRRRDFTGGENKKVLPEAIAPNQVLEAMNCVIDRTGILQTREGLTALTSSFGAGSVLSVHRYTKEDGTQYLCVQHGTTLYSSLWDGVSSLVGATWTSAKTGLTANAKLRSVVWKDVLILTNGSDQPFTWNGTTATNIAAAPKSKLIAVYASKLWLVPVTQPNCLQFSALEDYVTWDALDLIKIVTGDGDTITGIVPLQGGMSIFKQNSVRTLYGFDRTDISVTEPIANIGCISLDGAISEGVFLAKDNLYRFDLTSVSPVSDTHADWIASQALSVKQSAIIAAHPVEQRAVCYFGGGLYESLCIDAMHGMAITTWRFGLAATCFAVADDKTDTGTLLVGLSNGKVAVYGGSTDAGAVITTSIKDAYQDFGEIRKFAVRYVETDAETLEGGTLEANYVLNYDYGNTSQGMTFTDTVSTSSAAWGYAAWGYSTWGAPSGSFSRRFYIHGLRGRRCSFGLIVSGVRINYYGHIYAYKEVGT